MGISVSPLHMVKLPHAHFDPWHEHAMRITVVILLTTQTTTYTLLNKIVCDFDKGNELLRVGTPRLSTCAARQSIKAGSW